MTPRPDVVVLMTDQERAAPPYESEDLTAWRDDKLAGAKWFEDNGVSFRRHYTGSLACVPSRPTLFTGQYPDVHGVSQTNGLGKMEDDARMRWLRPGEVPTLGHWFRAGGYDTQYVGKWHMTHADLHDPVTDGSLATHNDDGVLDQVAVRAYLDADVLDPFGFSGWVGPEPHGGTPAVSGTICDPVYADRAVAWLEDRYARRRAGDAEAQRPFLLVVCFVNPHDIVFAPAWLGPIGADNPFTDNSAGLPDVPASPTDDDDVAIGGRYKEVLTFEYNRRFKSVWAVALFADVGRAFDEFDAPYNVGAGFGIRWLSPVGPFRIDFAFGVSEDDVPFQLHLSLGPEL